MITDEIEFTPAATDDSIDFTPSATIDFTPVTPAPPVPVASPLPKPPGLVRSMIGSAAQGAAGNAAGLLRAVGEGAAALGRATGLGETDPTKLGTFRLGESLEAGAREMFPTNPEHAAGFWTGDVPSGVGQVAGLIAGGGLGKAAVQGGLTRLGVEGAEKLATRAAVRGALATGTGAEFDDAYQRSVTRGDSPDLATAKASAYAVLSAGVESKLGLGRLMQRFGVDPATSERAIEQAARRGTLGVFLKEGLAGMTEEALQRAGQDLIVDGQLDLNAIAREGGAGAVVQGLLGAAGNRLHRPAATERLAWLRASQQNGVTLEEARASGLTPETLAKLKIAIRPAEPALQVDDNELPAPDPERPTFQMVDVPAADATERDRLRAQGLNVLDLTTPADEGPIEFSPMDFAGSDPDQITFTPESSTPDPTPLAPAATSPAAAAAWSATTLTEAVPVKGVWDVVDAGELRTSFDAGYDQTLQPRDRSRQASGNQIASIVQRLEPQRLGDAATTDMGAPIVDDRNQVLSGNGRVSALRTLYGASDVEQIGQMQQGRNEDYRQWLRQNSDRFGIPIGRIAGMAHPILVRRVTDYGGLTPQEFARQSNQQQVLGLGESEKAASDARLLIENPGLLDTFLPAESGDVMAASNRGFLNAFIQGTADQATLLTDQGYNAPAVERRVKNAILGALIGPENRNLLGALIERADALAIRSQVNALMATAPALVKFKGSQYDLSAVIERALTDLTRLKQSGETIEDFLGQSGLFPEPGRSGETDALLHFLSTATSAKQIIEGLTRYARAAQNAIADAQSGGMFGGEPAPRHELIQRLTQREINPATLTQTDFTRREPQAIPRPPANAQGQAPGGGVVSGQAELRENGSAPAIPAVAPAPVEIPSPPAPSPGAAQPSGELQRDAAQSAPRPTLSESGIREANAEIDARLAYLTKQYEDLHAELDRWGKGTDKFSQLAQELQHVKGQIELLQQIANSPIETQFAWFQRLSEDQPRDRIEAMLNTWIEATKLDPSKLQEGITGAPVWLTKAAANGVLRVVRAAYIATRDLAQAIREGVAWLKAQSISGFNEPEAEAWLKTVGIREHAAKRLENDQWTEKVKAAIEEVAQYKPKSFAETREDVAKFIQAAGEAERAIPLYFDRRYNLPGDVRFALGLTIGETLVEAEVTARNSGDRIEADRLAAVNGEFQATFVPETTEQARGLNVLRMVGTMTPLGADMFARRTIKRAGEAQTRRTKPVLDGVSDQIRRVNAEAIEQAAASPEVQRAARGAVNSSVKAEGEQKGTELETAIVLEATNSMDQMADMGRKRRELALRALQGVPRTLWEGLVGKSSNALAAEIEARLQGQDPAARADTVASLAGDLQRALSQQIHEIMGVDPQRTPPKSYFTKLQNLLANAERMSQIWSQVRDKLKAQYAGNEAVQRVLDSTVDVWSKALLKGVVTEYLKSVDVSLQELVAYHYRAANDGRTLADRIVERLGLDPIVARRLAAGIDDVFRTEIARIRNDLDNRIAATRKDPRFIRMIKSGMVNLDYLPGEEVSRALAGAIRRRQIKMGLLVRQHYTEQTRVGRQLAADLATEAGLTGEAAAKLAAAVQRQFEAFATERKRSILNSLVGREGRKLRKRSVSERIIELSNLGAFDDARMWAAVAERLGLPQYTRELAVEVKRQASELQALPEGSIQRMQATVRMMNTISRGAGVNKADLAWSFWYANTLSGPITHLVNTWSNITSLVANVGVLSRGNPFAVPRVLAAMAKGFAPGLREARSIMREGAGAQLHKFAEASRALELLQPGDFTGSGLLRHWRIVGRALAAADAALYFPAREAKAMTLARSLAKTEGLIGPALVQRTQEILYGTEAQAAAAEAQLESEAAQLAAAGKPVDALWRARRLQQILETNRPESLRERADDFAIRATFNNHPYGLIGILARAVNMVNRESHVTRAVVPFVNVVANVTNEALNYSPLGFARGGIAAYRGKIGEVPVGSDAIIDLHAKAAIGTALLGAVAIAAVKALDDDDGRNFQMFGRGPDDPDKRKALRAGGWIPYSIRINGRYYAYVNTVMAIPLASLGNYVDARRYGGAQWDQAGALDRVAFAAATGAHVVTQQSFLDGIARLLGAIQDDGGKLKGAGGRAVEVLGRTVTSAVIPNALRQVDRMWDPTLYDRADVTANLMASIPFVRATGRPALNAFGEPITSPLTARFTSPARDNLWADMTRRNLFVTLPEKDHVWARVNRAMTDEEFYRYVGESGQVIHTRLQAAWPTVKNLPLPKAKKAVEDITSRERQRVRTRMGFGP